MPQSVNCFFLRLPVEVRLMIYDYVFDNQVLHISTALDSRSGTKKLDHRLCVCEKQVSSESWVVLHRQRWLESSKHDKPVNFTFTERTRPYDIVPDTWMSHNGCLRHRNKDRYNIALVKTCRQIYHETNLIPYQKNTFSFDDRETLERFLMIHTPVSRAVELAQSKRRAIRNLQLHTIYDVWYDSHEGNSTGFGVAKCLKNLNHLELCIDLGFQNWRVFANLCSTTEFFTAFHDFPFTSVKVDVTDPSFGSFLRTPREYLVMKSYRTSARTTIEVKDLNAAKIIDQFYIGLREMKAWDSVIIRSSI
ncbi:hypothetical protein MMC07_006128 [Pseudocyphellaria aurata]|nr:hypothetical protein [Pseudocyphellaria aurata]